MKGRLTSEDIRQVFGLLNDRLAVREVHGQLRLIGGAAMSMYGFARHATTDVDAVIMPENEILSVAEELAPEIEMEAGWLNSSAAQFLPEGYGEAFTWVLVWEQSNLEIYVPPEEVLLYMKLRAARGKDLEDIRVLIGRMGLTSIEECEQILHCFRPGEDLSSRAHRVLAAIFHDDHPSRDSEYFKPAMNVPTINSPPVLFPLKNSDSDPQLGM